MNVSLLNNDTVSCIVKLEIEKKDYEMQIEKNLRQYRQKANMPGFRKGMVPLGLIKKMYGKSVLVDELNKLVSENLLNYINENQIRILGEPIPNETEQQPIDFDVQESFEFYFDLALSPVLTLKFNKRDKLNWYVVIVEDEQVNAQLDSYRQNFGTYEQVDEITEEDMVKGIVTELEEGKPKEHGIVVEEAILIPKYIKGKREQSKFIGSKINDTIIFNPKKAYKGVTVEIASFLKVDKEVAQEITADFQFEIKDITRYKEAELNKELFDKVLGKDVVETEEAFKEIVKLSILETYLQQSEYLFAIDVRKLFIKKAGDVKLADSVLKRWLLATNQDTTPDKVEENYPQIAEDLIFHLAKEQIIKDNNLIVEDTELENMAKKITKAQFAQYGMLTIPDDILEKYAKNMLKENETSQNLIDRTKEDKLVNWIKGQVKVETKAVLREEFEKLFT
jgi:trigger factor